MYKTWPRYLLVTVSLILFSFPGYLLYQLLHTSRPSAAHEIWFEDLSTFIPLENEEAGVIMRDIIHGVTGDEEQIQGLFTSLTRDKSPQIVFISASDTNTRARVALGTGHGLAMALKDAVARLRTQGLDDKDLRWLKLDIVKPPDARTARSKGETSGIDLSLEGIAFPRSTALAILPTAVVAWRALDNDGQLLLENLPDSMQYLLAPLWRRVAARFSASMHKQLYEEISPRGFSTESFFFDGEETLRLYRGQRVRTTATPESLLQTARLAGTYLQQSTSPNGKFAYRYLPGTDELTDDYNLVRHAGTIYAMLELYEIDKNHKLLNSAQRAIDYLLGFVRDYGSSQNEMSVLVSGETIKLGGVALTIVALAKYTEVTLDRKYLPVMVRLAHYIRNSQLDNGAFISQRYYPGGNVRKDFTSQYYPGEAILALLRLYALKQSEIWLETAEEAARYLITVRDQAADTRELVHDHWLLYALNDLYGYQPRYLYLTHAMRISRAITLGQNHNSRNADYIGSYYLPPRSTPTATRTEGLLAAYAMARDTGRLPDAGRIRPAIELGIGFQLQTQIRPEKAMYLEDPQQALGGFHKSLDDYEVRIDYVQHNLSAILGYYQLLQSDRVTEIKSSH